MTEIEVYEGAPNPAVGSLVEWAESARAAHAVATSLVSTSFVPEAFRGKANEATAAILAGMEVGLQPMAALRSFDVIQGVAAPRAITQRAIVQSQGHDVWVVESTDEKAIVEGRRRGSEQTQRSVWTIARAQKLGLTGKHNWKAQPAAMLVARATSECCRLVASDAILGLPYSAEELSDAGDDPTPVKRRTAKRADPAPEPALYVQDPEPEETPAEVDAEAATGQQDDNADGATRAQVTKLNIQLVENGIDDRDAKLRYLSGVVGRELASSNDLTRAEASSLIDMLEGSAEEPPL